MANDPHVDDALRTGEFAVLHGLAEDEHLDAKQLPYDLSMAVGRCELAKDVSAFANASGGCLLFGPATEPDPVRSTDVITSVDLLQPGDFEPSQYEGIIKQLVYPKIVDLRVEFILSATDDGGIGAILVPAQDPDRGPFLVTRVVEEGEELNSSFVAYYERRGSHNLPMQAIQLYQRFRAGMDSTAQRLSRIEDKIDTLGSRDDPLSSDGQLQEQLLADRLAESLREVR